MFYCPVCLRPYSEHSKSLVLNQSENNGHTIVISWDRGHTLIRVAIKKIIANNIYQLKTQTIQVSTQNQAFTLEEMLTVSSRQFARPNSLEGLSELMYWFLCDVFPVSNCVRQSFNGRLWNSSLVKTDGADSISFRWAFEFWLSFTNLLLNLLATWPKISKGACVNT
jgi:hypothetical protein